MAIYSLRNHHYGYSTLSAQEVKECLAVRESQGYKISNSLLLSSVGFVAGGSIATIVNSSVSYIGVILIGVLLISTGLVRMHLDKIRITLADLQLGDGVVYPSSHNGWKPLIVEILLVAKRNEVDPFEIERHFLSLLLVNHLDESLKAIVDDYLKLCSKLPASDCRTLAQKIINEVFTIVNEDMQPRGVVVEFVDYVKLARQIDTHNEISQFIAMHGATLDPTEEDALFKGTENLVVRVSNKLELSTEDNAAIDIFSSGRRLVQDDSELSEALGLPVNVKRSYFRPVNVKRSYFRSSYSRSSESKRKDNRK